MTAEATHMDSSGSGKYALLDQIAEEFAERRRRGEYPTLREYVEKYPHLADDLRDILPTMAEIEQVKHDASGTAPPLPPAPLPQQIGDYRILREVGRGGMGVVYEAEQESLGRRVALKVLPPHTLKEEKALERFRREARAAAKLHHTNIVPVFEVGQGGGACFYAMQFIQGQALDQVIEELRRLREHSQGTRPAALGEAARSLLTGVYKAQELTEGYAPAEDTPPSAPASGSGVTPLSGAESSHPHYFRSVAGIGQQVAQALAYAHARHIIHRDIKPSNLLLDAAGVVWVTDFGLAKTDDDGLTNTGDIVGTLRYMAPERFEGHGDARADVYALGLTLYELLTLRPAFAARDRLKLIEQIRTTEPPRPRSVDRRVPRDLETIVLKAMDKDANRRYKTAEELAQDLGRFLDDEPIHARAASLAERGWRWVRRRPAVAGLFAALTVAAVALIAVAVTLHYNRELREARDQADLARKEAVRARDSEIRLRGLLAVRAGQFGQAIDDLKGIAPIFPDDRSVWMALGQAYAGAEQPEKAIDAYGRALALEGDDVEALVARAREHARLRRFKSAVADYAAAFRINPNLGQCAEEYARALYEDAAWADLEIIEMKSAGGNFLIRRPGNTVLTGGNGPGKDTCTIVARSPLPRTAMLRLEMESSPPLRGVYGFRAERSAPRGETAPAPVEFTWQSAADTPDDFTTSHDYMRFSPTVYVLREPIADPQGARLIVRIDIPAANLPNKVVGDTFRLSAASRTDLIAIASLLDRPKVNGWMKLAAAHCLCGDGKAALESLDKATGQEHIKHDFYLLKALALFQCGRRGEGRKALADVLSNQSAGGTTQWLTIAAISKLLDDDPHHLEELLVRARCYQRVNWWRPAVADFERVHQFDPKDADILLECGECRLALGDAGGAAADFEAARQINRQAAFDHHQRRLLEKLDFADALVHRDALARAARGTPQEAAWLLPLAEMYARTEQHAEALAALDRLLEIAPTDPKVLLLAANVHRKRAETSALLEKQEEARKDWQEMRRLLEKRLALEPDSGLYAAELAQGLFAERGGWTLVRPLESKADSGTLTVQPDGSILAQGGKENGAVYTLSADVDWKGVRAVKMELLGDLRLPDGGPGRGPKGDFSPPNIELIAPRSSGLPAASVSLPREPVAFGNLYRRWWDYVVYQPAGIPDDARGKTSILIRGPGQDNKGDLGRWRLAVTNDPQTFLNELVADSSVDGWLKLAAAHALNGDRKAALDALDKYPARDGFGDHLVLAWIHLRVSPRDYARGSVAHVATQTKDLKSPPKDPQIRGLAALVFEKARQTWPDDKELRTLLDEAQAALGGAQK
jgi:serine/threonine protein kinase/Flp pilus assembly protein TadD